MEIAPAKLTVETAEKSPLTVLEGTTIQETLSGISYKVTDSAGKDVTKTMQENHIWGTGFDDSNVSQIYEPLFTLQEQRDGKWQDIDDADYPLVGGGKYRVVYKGRKAIFNANGTYSHRTGINQSGNINGVDQNYETVTEPTADDKALAVEVTPGTEAEIDISKLLEKGAKTFAELTAFKEYDGKPVSDESIKAGWQIVETVQQTPPAESEIRTYRQYDYEEGYFNGDAAASYELQGGAEKGKEGGYILKRFCFHYCEAYGNHRTCVCCGCL